MRIGNYRIFEREQPASKPAPTWRTLNQENKRGAQKREESSPGKVDTSLGTSEKLPHPPQMHNYTDLNRDAEVGTAIDTLANMRAGVGFYTEMPKGTQKDPSTTHPNKKKVDEWCESVNLDEILVQIERVRLGKGICPVEKVRDEPPKLLPPESFYIWRKPTGDVYRYTQEDGSGNVLAEWKKNELDKLVLFKRNEDPSHPYGQALAENIVPNIDMRRQMNEDIPDVIHKYAYPFRVVEATSKEVMDVFYKAYTSRGVDEDILLDNIEEGDLRIHTETMDPRINFTEYVVHNDEQIAEALHAPLLIYLRNATEASANTMLEVIELDNQAAQRYNKRRVERHFFKPLVGDPVPRLIWGSPKSGLENVTLAELTDAFYKGSVSFDQAQDMMKKLGLPLLEQKQPTQGAAPGQLTPQNIPPALQMQLNALEASNRAGKITLTEALQEGNACITSSIELMKAESLKTVNATGVKAEKLSPSSEQYYADLHSTIYTHYRGKVLPAGAPGAKPKAFKVELLE